MVAPIAAYLGLHGFLLLASEKEVFRGNLSTTCPSFFGYLDIFSEIAAGELLISPDFCMNCE